jgi:hypothetical protein
MLRHLLSEIVNGLSFLTLGGYVPPLPPRGRA